MSEKQNYLLDTNIISEIIRENPDFNILKKLVEHSSDCAMSVFSLQEMLYGAGRLEDGQRKTALLDYIKNDAFETFPVISYGAKAAEINAGIQAQMSKKGITISYGDCFIAAIALAENMILVTRNTKHYEPLASEYGLKLENWFEE